MSREINYFDNAATSFPKPAGVYQAHEEYFKQAGNPGRGAHQLALNSARTIFDTRVKVAQFLGVQNSERVIFTPGCTHSINMVLFGCELDAGATVLTSALEHNAVMRPLNHLAATRTVNVVQLPYAERRIVAPEVLMQAIKVYKPALCVFTDASNVTGERLDLDAVSQICTEHGVPLLIDAAQTAGLEQDVLARADVTYWAASAHKSFLGAPGLGVLVLGAGAALNASVYGGTGSNSENLTMPSEYPDLLEPGTLPGPAIAALGAGIEYIESINADKIAEHEHELAERFRSFCYSQSHIQVAGKTYSVKQPLDVTEVIPVVSFRLKTMTSDRVADLLNEKFSIAVRSGLHCAASAHATLNTLGEGLVRVSFGCFNAAADVDFLMAVLKKLD